MDFFWMVIVLGSLLAYVVLDGFDLGVGVITMFERDASDRRLLLEVVGNVWDGNESWLIMLAMAIWGGFPEAYGTALPGLYLPLVVMLFALIFRGFAIEMALHRPLSDRIWTWFFGAGSLVAAFAQGVLFGGLLTGVIVRNGEFAGSTWDFFGHGYAVLTGLATIALYCLAGAARMQSKVEGNLRDKMAALLRPLTLATAVAVALSAALLPAATTAHLTLDGVDRYMSFAYAVLVAVAGFVTVYWRAGRAPDRIPFLAVAAVETAGMVAFVCLYFPQIVPPSVTIYSSASGRETMDFLAVSVGVLVPITVGYHAFANWVFRGRQSLELEESEGGH